MMGYYIAIVIAAMLCGDTAGIIIKLLKINNKFRSYDVVINKEIMGCTSRRVNNTYLKLCSYQMVSFIIEFIIMTLILSVVIFNKEYKTGLILTFLIIAVTISAIKIIDTLKNGYILDTLTDIIYLGAKCNLLDKERQSKEGVSNRVAEQLKHCENSIDDLYTFVDKINSKESYDKTPQLKNNIEKIKKELDIIGDKLNN